VVWVALGVVDRRAGTQRIFYETTFLATP